MLHLCLTPRWNFFVVLPDAGRRRLNKREKRGWGIISRLLPLVNTQHSNSWTSQDKMKLFKWEFPFTFYFHLAISMKFLWFEFWLSAGCCSPSSWWPPAPDSPWTLSLEVTFFPNNVSSRYFSPRWRLFIPTMSLFNISYNSSWGWLFPPKSVPYPYFSLFSLEVTFFPNDVPAFSILLLIPITVYLVLIFMKNLSFDFSV